jgi:hypothetical protein
MFLDLESFVDKTGEKDFSCNICGYRYIDRNLEASEPEFVNLLRSPGIDSQPGGIDFLAP